MTYGSLLQFPHDQAPPLTSAGIRMLRQSVRQQLPLKFRVASTTVEKNFDVYNCDVSSVTTNNSWHVSYRFSDFTAFIKKVEEHGTCQHKRCCGSCEAIREFLWACFPKKRRTLFFRHRSAHTIADRTSKIETAMQYLLRSVLLPGSAMKCLYLRRNLPARLFQFLGVYQEADKRSLLQVFVDNCQGASSKCSLRGSLHSDASTVDSTDCVICLEGIEATDCCHGPSSSVVLPCQHAFHRECIFEWLLFNFHCPMCRARIGPPAAISYCRERSYIFQWWLSEFQEDPLLSLPSRDTI